MVFYRKYRPLTVSELDNQQVSETIAKFLSRDHIPHAFLFTGSKGTGKTSTARIIAKSINCLKPKSGQACGKCDNCVSIGNGTNMDVLEIDAASNRGIDEIRDLREKIKLAPSQLTYKVYIIDEVHMLTNEAFNALLKTLEEPPVHAVFILATTEAHKVPDTIGSRCIRVHFHKATHEEIKHSLHRIIKGENLEIEEGALALIAAASDGSFRDGAKYLEEAALLDKKITADAVQTLLGMSDSLVRDEFLKAVQEKDAAKMLKIVISLKQEGRSIGQFFTTILTLLEKILVDSYSKSSDWKNEELMLAIKKFSTAFSEMKTAVIPALPFEMAIAEYCAIPKIAAANSAVPTPQSVSVSTPIETEVSDLGNVELVIQKWPQILESLKEHNHSIVGVLRSCRPFSFIDDVLTIEANYKFHAERLLDSKVRDVIAKVVGDVLGLQVKIMTVLKKR